MKAKTHKTLFWTIFAISALLLVLVMVFPGERTNNISVLRMVVMIAFASRGLDLSVQIGFLRTSGWIRTIHAFYMHITGYQNNFV